LLASVIGGQTPLFFLGPKRAAFALDALVPICIQRIASVIGERFERLRPLHAEQFPCVTRRHVGFPAFDEPLLEDCTCEALSSFLVECRWSAPADLRISECLIEAQSQLNMTAQS
jgi:hypothetical protein